MISARLLDAPPPPDMCAQCGKRPSQILRTRVTKRPGQLERREEQEVCLQCFHNPSGEPKPAPAPALIKRRERHARGTYPSPEAAEERAWKVAFYLGCDVPNVNGCDVFPDAPIVPGYSGPNPFKK